MSTPAIVYYIRFPDEPVKRLSAPSGHFTYACRVKWVDSEGEEGELIGLAGDETSARRTGLNLRTRHKLNHGYDAEYEAVEVVSVGKLPPIGIKGVDRFLKLYWKPEAMSKAWAKTLHFKGRYLVTHESIDFFYVVILKEEYKVSKKYMEILHRDAEGKRVKNGPIFERDF